MMEISNVTQVFTDSCGYLLRQHQSAFPLPSVLLRCLNRGLTRYIITEYLNVSCMIMSMKCSEICDNHRLNKKTGNQMLGTGRLSWKTVQSWKTTIDTTATAQTQECVCQIRVNCEHSVVKCSRIALHCMLTECRRNVSSVHQSDNTYRYPGF